ncbi:MAG: dethiobiotin synthase [Bacteroidota bacterium]
MNYFMTGIGTEVGKTVVSAILVEALKADYWKPVQCGDLDFSDSMKIGDWVTHSATIHPERYRLKLPMSPHAAAEQEQVQIQLSDFQLPQTKGPLIVEGAGGLMVPLNDQDLMLDLIAHLKIPAIVVSRHYLGSINHTLLSIKVLQQAGIPIEGIIFSGEAHPTTESIIIKHVGPELILGRINDLATINSDSISEAAGQLQAEHSFFQLTSKV